MLQSILKYLEATLSKSCQFKSKRKSIYKKANVGKYLKDEIKGNKITEYQRIIKKKRKEIYRQNKTKENPMK